MIDGASYGAWGGSNYTLLNSGAISSNDTGVFAGNDTFISNTGLIEAGTARFDYGIFLSSNATIDNFGSISGGTGIFVRSVSTIINRADASIVATNGDAVILGGAGSSIRNLGTIEAASEGIFAFSTQSTIFNSGTVLGSDGIEAISGTIRNSGTITSDSPSAFGRAIYLRGNSSLDMLIVNSGILEGNNAVYSRGAEVNFVNSGVANGNIVLFSGDDVIRNSGTITGDITSGFGDDLYDARMDGTLTGSLDLGGGDDLYLGGAGGVTGNILGGNGDDTFILSVTDETIDGGSGDDVVRLSGAMSDYTITVNADGSITVTGGPEGTDTLTNVEFIRFSDDLVRINDLIREDVVIGADQTGDIVLNSDLDTLTVDAGVTLTGDAGLPATVTAADGAALITNNGNIIGPEAAIDLSTDINGVIIKNAGTMTGSVTTGSGNDVVNTLNGTIDGDVILGDGNDLFRGGDGLDSVFGGDGEDRLLGGDGDDVLDGGDRADVLNGGNGNDNLIGGAGNDTLFGRAGNDVIDGGDGNADLARYDGDIGDYDIVIAGDGTITITDTRAAPVEGIDTLVNVEILKFNDGFFTVTASGDLVEGLG